MNSHYDFFQNRLGAGAKLAIKFYILDAKGMLIAEDGYNEHVSMPMASVKKVAIALCTLRKIFCEKKSLKDNIRIRDEDFSPGPPWNVLDRLFFLPWNTETSKSIDELITIMLRDSDNTATDVLIDYAGGIEAINLFMQELGIDGYHLTMNSKKLLADYYQFEEQKSMGNICNVLYEFASAFDVRSTETGMFLQKKDSCTASSMNKLLGLMVLESRKNDDTWLSWASKIVCDRMQLCLTGNDLIRAGTKKFQKDISFMGDKTGSFGGVDNDSAFLKLGNGNWIILSIFTCLSPQEYKARNQIIADITEDILERNSQYISGRLPESVVLS